MKSLLLNQNKAKEHLSSWKVGALFMEPGTGKTRVAMELIKKTPCDFIIWLGPLRTLDSIKDEIKKWGGIEKDITFYGVESLSLSDRIYHELLNTIDKADKPFVVVDESLKIKNAWSKRTKRILDISKKVEYKLILNGTPLTKNLMDLWPQMEFLSPKILNMDLRRFKDTFCKYTTIKKYDGWRNYKIEYITGYSNIDYLYSLIRHYVFECDLSLNISQNYRTVYYYLDFEEKETYNNIKLHYLNDIVWRNSNIFMAMTQDLQHSYCCCEDKFKVIDSLFEEIEEARTIIFCKFIKSREECEKRYKKAKVLSYQKEALGLNLQEFNNTIYFDKIWDYALRIQSGFRTFRTGQEYDCKYFDLTGNVGLESMIDKNIAKKISMSEYFKSKTKEEIASEL